MFGFKIVFWYWWALAAVLLVFEMLLPGVVFLFLAIGAAAAGFVLLVVSDLSLELQLVLFAVVAGGGTSVYTYAVCAGAGRSTTVRSLLTAQALTRPAAMAIMARMTLFMTSSFGLWGSTAGFCRGCCLIWRGDCQ